MIGFIEIDCLSDVDMIFVVVNGVVFVLVYNGNLMVFDLCSG